MIRHTISIVKKIRWKRGNTLSNVYGWSIILSMSGISLQGKVRFLTGGMYFWYEPASLFGMIQWESGADGIVRMEEELWCVDNEILFLEIFIFCLLLKHFRHYKNRCKNHFYVTGSHYLHIIWILALRSYVSGLFYLIENADFVLWDLERKNHIFIDCHYSKTPP